MFTFALLVAATAHDPSPDDIYRFGFHTVPLVESVPRAVWNETRANVYELRQPKSEWLVYGRERLLASMIDDGHWRERCWDAVDDMGRTCCTPENRLAAARRLREYLGPVDYYLGNLPASSPDRQR